MSGFLYSIKQNYSFSKQELQQIFWTSSTFALILTAFFKGFLRKPVIIEDTIIFFAVMIVFSFIALYSHVAFQKIVGIRLGYTVTYVYWTNGILFSLFFAFFSLGLIPFSFPGAITMQHNEKLRLGKFRYGTNLKDLARISVAGPMSHIIIVMIFGIIYFATNKSEVIFSFIIVNLLYALYSILPIPKIDIPTKMDSATDGMGLFFYTRTGYVLALATVIFYVILVFMSTVFSFVIAFILGLIMALLYSVYVEQKN